MIGIYWAHHHYVFKHYQQTNHAFNLLNPLFLLRVCLLPFPIAVLGSYMFGETNQTTAAAFYAVGPLLPAACWMLMWLYPGHRRKLADHRLESGFLRRLTVKHVAPRTRVAG